MIRFEASAFSVGDHIRKLREQRTAEGRSYSLRQVAARCAVTPAYLSRVERNEVAPPGEATLVRLAVEIGEDPDVLLAMAGKISADVREIIHARPRLLVDLIRSIKSIQDDAVLRIIRDIKEGKR